MKKIVTLGAASVLAVLPTVTTFAATGTTVTDTIEVSIDSACAITSDSATNTYSATLTNGSTKNNWTTKTMTINCNDAGGWKVTAVGNGADTTNKHYMNASGSGTDIATGTATSGGTSNWAFKVTGTGASGYTNWSAVPSTAATVASNTGSSSGVVLTPAYQVYVSATQQADTYTGKVKYTLVHPKGT